MVIHYLGRNLDLHQKETSSLEGQGLLGLHQHDGEGTDVHTSGHTPDSKIYNLEEFTTSFAIKLSAYLVEKGTVGVDTVEKNPT